MSAEDSVQEAAFGALGGLGPVEVWRSGSLRAKNVQLPETPRLYHLQRSRKTERFVDSVWVDSGRCDLEVDVPRSARLWERCLC